MLEKSQFQEKYPGIFFIEPAMDARLMERYLKTRNWISEAERVVSIERAGEGNMNCVLRVRIGDRSLVVKQARPWVEKYPSISAPVSRAKTEAAFYDAVSEFHCVASRMPKFIGMDGDCFLIALADLGASSDLLSLYKGDNLESCELSSLTDYLVALHGAESEGIARFPNNREMRNLNHEHIFRFPLERESDLGAQLQGDIEYRKSVRELGDIYLEDGRGRSLLHGDFYPGSWVRTTTGIKVLDPEFAFVGIAEFDLGVMAAHLIFADAFDKVEDIFKQYRRRRPFDEKLALGFAGVELMRRLLGVAQLPLQAGTEKKREWLSLSAKLVKGCFVTSGSRNNDYRLVLSAPPP